MEAVGALGRVRPRGYFDTVRDAVRSRSRTFWIVAGLTALAAALRFATLGIQSYHHDEIVTASRILRDGFWHAMDAVGFSESAPPLYYALAWPWTQLTGTDELGLRSLSAVAGVATVPVAFLLGRTLLDRRAGIVAAALVAVNPMLVWYSQEGRAYALFVLLTSLSLLYFVRALEASASERRDGLQGGGTFERRDVLLWGLFSGLALATHYFAAFPAAAEAAWLAWRRRRTVMPGVAVAAGFGVALAPLVVHQASYKHADWISNFTLGHRVWETGVTFALGETGDIVAQSERVLPALLPALALAAGLLLLWRRGGTTERHAAMVPLAIAAATVLVPLAIALVDPGKDYVLARNLLPALVPLLTVLAIGLTLPRARQAGTAIAAVLAVYWLGFSLYASLAPALQRPDWDGVAAELGESATPRAMVTWTIGLAPLRYYLSTGSIQARADEGFEWWVGEVDFISDGPAPPPSRRVLGPGLREAGYTRAGRLYIRRYATPGPELIPLRLRIVRDAELGFRSNGVLLDGIGPG